MPLQNVLIQLPQMSAVHVLDGPAHLALQEDTVPVGVAVAVLPAGPLIRHQLVDQPLLLQPLQLAVYGGQSHGLPAAAEPVRQHHGRGAAAGTGGDAVQHCLLLPGHIGHMRHLADLKMKTVFRL